jgi:hypothetical protein
LIPKKKESLEFHAALEEMRASRREAPGEAGAEREPPPMNCRIGCVRRRFDKLAVNWLVTAKEKRYE